MDKLEEKDIDFVRYLDLLSKKLQERIKKSETIFYIQKKDEEDNG
jgi:hypothetical protein